jgi:hypothetical protein
MEGEAVVDGGEGDSASSSLLKYYTNIY